MNRFFLFLIFLAASFAAGFGAARWKAFDLLSAKLTHSPGPKARSEFFATDYPLESLPFCVVIIGRNNGAYLEKTLRSVFSQVYENFRIVYVDDASDDGSFDLAKDVIYASPHLNKVRILQNEKKIGHLASLSSVVRGCVDDEIVVVLHGEDWLAHEWALKRLNQYFADPDLWLAYSQSLEYPSFQMSAAEPVPESSMRTFSSASSLQAFYAGPFKKINENDFLYKGEFFPAAAGLAYMIPLLEMAKEHSHALSEVLSIYSTDSKMGEDRDQTVCFEQYIRSLKPHEKLLSLETGQGAEVLE